MLAELGPQATASSFLEAHEIFKEKPGALRSMTSQQWRSFMQMDSDEEDDDLWDDDDEEELDEGGEAGEEEDLEEEEEDDNDDAQKCPNGHKLTLRQGKGAICDRCQKDVP